MSALGMLEAYGSDDLPNQSRSSCANSIICSTRKASYRSAEPREDLRRRTDDETTYVCFGRRPSRRRAAAFSARQFVAPELRVPLRDRNECAGKSIPSSKIDTPDLQDTQKQFPSMRRASPPESTGLALGSPTMECRHDVRTRSTSSWLSKVIPFNLDRTAHSLLCPANPLATGH